MKAERHDMPVICCLSDTELREREATILARFKSAVIETEELPDGYQFFLSGDGKGIAAAAELIAVERECCRFLTFALTVAPNGGPAALRITGPLGTKDFLRTTYVKG